MELGQREIALRGGRIVLYTRADDRHGIWQARMRLGTDRTLVRRSMKTTDLAEAKRTAEELYEELRYKQRHDHPLKDQTFKQLAEDYVRKAKRDTLEGRLSKGRLVLVEGTLRRYLLPFFGKRPINSLTTADFNDYDDWRLDYWTRGYGADRVAANAAAVPSAKTLVMEQSILRQILKHGLEQGSLKQLAFMRAKRAKTNRRGAFDVAEYKLLRRTARRRSNQAEHPRVKRDRQLLDLYVRLLVGTGMRVGEARGLTWRDVELINTGNGKVTETLRLWVDGKTGKRAVIGTRAAKVTVKKLLAHYGWKDLDEARASGQGLFANGNGEDIHTFEVGFKNLMAAANLDMDRHGNARTLYSLRHTYATFRLLYGGTDVYLLSRNMGTSVAMIEKHYGHVSTTLAADRLV
ncbi:tyrosine-type recombinase/integrase [Paramagnetospirillum magneticum]|uniref:Integrase n=1 Tax=Paramagnetospirillum magneticum (strain ATCC 700264 / AMB-1) TaxID=342108 RepID=Q2W5E8_PARM1|nr:tyrosine-type recombinase/integrase [Paramagnetospirillum magneticum]BAE50927.1 Integrase [Paramagnetospirillum magneticum AMB-1]